MRYVDNPKASNFVPIPAFYAYRISFIVVRDIRGVVDLQHDLVVSVYIRQLLGKSGRTLQPPNVAPVNTIQSAGRNRRDRLSKKRSKANAQGEVIPRTVKIPKWYALFVVEEICTPVLPDKGIAQCSRT
jgi:hypothetical protein